jgi:cytochrome c oxidase subunit II
MYSSNLQLYLSGFKTPANDTMYGLVVLYSDILGICLLILVCVTILLSYILDSFSFKSPSEEEEEEEYFHKFPNEFTRKAESLLDIFFLFLPTLIIVYILIPTIGFIYSSNLNNEKIATSFTIDIIGNQWYWSYGYNIEICNNSLLNLISNDFIFNKIQYESIMVKVPLKGKGVSPETSLRLLLVDKSLFIPVNVYIDCYLTSEDVLHSWAVPQFGIKVDAIPGRISNFLLYSNFVGVYHGQCSELCGVLHGFMPISVSVLSHSNFFIFMSCITGWFKGFEIL